METVWRVSPMPWATAPFQATKESSVVPSVWSLGVLYHKSAHSKAHHRASAASNRFFIGPHFIAKGHIDLISCPWIRRCKCTLTRSSRGSAIDGLRGASPGAPSRVLRALGCASAIPHQRAAVPFPPFPGAGGPRRLGTDAPRPTEGILAGLTGHPEMKLRHGNLQIKAAKATC